MNTTTPTDHPLIDPEIAVWGARLTAYLAAMGMVVLQYDCFLTLKDEVSLVLYHRAPSPLTFFSAGTPCLAWRPLLPKSPLLP
jgi:hypothetical protein